MIIRDKRTKENQYELKVYAIYWAGGERYYFVIPPNYGGVLAMRESETEMLDPTLDSNFILVRNDNSNDMIMHKALYKDSLLDDLIDHDPAAMAELKRRIKIEDQKKLDEIEKVKNELDNDLRKKEEYLLCNYGITLEELKDIVSKVGL